MPGGSVTLDALLAEAAVSLTAAGSPSARLDAEVLLCHVLGVERTWLYTWGDREAGREATVRFRALLARRMAGEPVAYLTGEREFWGLTLATDPSTLIPRPDTETLVEAALALATAPGGRLLDLGTGSGAIALAFASERPGWHVLGLDIRPEAVALARQNAARHALANAAFGESDWFAALAGQDEDARFDLVVSNPPISPRTTRTWPRATCASSRARRWWPAARACPTCATWRRRHASTCYPAAGCCWNMAFARPPRCARRWWRRATSRWPAAATSPATSASAWGVSRGESDQALIAGNARLWYTFGR